ncbi:hypothetical protein HYU21_02670 [Candidatus Woesearchaeota archaeon]|nr:hypothetical protein [Candidatus Woesearchaeota archaeon]
MKSLKHPQLKKYGKFPTPPRRKSFSATTQHKIILLFSILLLFTGVLLLYYLTATGQAITGIEEGVYANLNRTDSTAQVLNLTIEPGTNSINSVYFELSVTTPATFKLCDTAPQITVRPPEIEVNGETLVWENSFSDCTNGKFSYAVGTVDTYKFLNTRFNLSISISKPLPSGDVTFFLEALDVYRVSDGTDLFVAGTNTLEQDHFTFSRGGGPPTLGGDGAQGSSGSGSSSSSSSSSSGGGGVICPANWDCSAWSLCNSTLQQSRTCIDLKKCKPNKIEVKKCQLCQESWTCSEWNTCQNNRKTRTCTDEHQCGTLLYRPTLQAACQSAPLTTTSYQPPKTPEPPIQHPLPPKSIWEEKKLYFIALPAAIVAVLITIILLLLIRKREVVLNFKDLVEWVKLLNSKGLSEQRIKDALEGSEWTKKEIEKALKSLR